MADSRKIDFLTIVCTAAAVLLCAALMIWNYAGEGAGSGQTDSAPGISTEYTQKLFDDSYVHVLNIQISSLNWNYMISQAEEEQYVPCDVTIDGETVHNAAVRPKGNSSLASIAAQSSEHFSYKIEFDHYTAGNTYFGLDKLALNNLSADCSCMKDYLAYHMMNDMGVNAPLSSYVLVQVNGENFGLYLAVEAVEDSFCFRNYGERYGELYRPDVFDINAITPDSFLTLDYEAMFEKAAGAAKGERVDILGQIINQAFLDAAEQVSCSAMCWAGSSARNYETVFDTSVFKLTNNDRQRFIDAVKTLNQSDTPQDALDPEQVIRYFVVHTFLNNYDGYTGVFVHNFYVHELDGRLSLIPWDYNLAFGAFSAESAFKTFFGGSGYTADISAGEGLSSDESYVNYPIDTPMYVVSNEERPMFNAWASQESYLARYHELYAEFLQGFAEGGTYEAEIQCIRDMIRPYIEKGLTFYTAERFETAADNLALYCRLRAESVSAQLNGQLASTLDGQAEDPTGLIEIGDLDLGTTIDFGGLAFGITSSDVKNALDILAGEETHDTEGLNASLEALAANPSQIPAMVLHVIEGTPLLQRFLGSAVLPPAILAASIIVLIIAVRFWKRTRKHGLSTSKGEMKHGHLPT